MAYFYQCTVMFSKRRATTRAFKTTWPKLMSKVDLEQSTQFTDQVLYVCDVEKSDPLNKLVSSSASTITKFHDDTKHNVISWSYYEQGHVHKCQTCVERNCELANKTADDFHTASMLCLYDHQFKKEELGTVGEMSEVCSQIVLTCLYLGRIDRQDILWDRELFGKAYDAMKHNMR